MLLFILAYLGGVLTILSPCILPVLPFVFARADQPFLRSGLPILAGMAATFALVATLAAVGGGWAVGANQYGRTIAIVLLALFGIALLFPSIAKQLTRPLVALGARLSQSADRDSRGNGGTILSSLLLGVATGLLWAPCAGPVLGLILTGAALQGASVATSLLLFAYAAGAATSLAIALLVGGRLFALMKRSLGLGEWLKRGLGVAVLAAVAAVAMGLDTGFLTRVSLSSTASLEQALLDRVQPNAQGAADRPAAAALAAGALPIEGRMPPLAGAVTWLNSPPLTAESLKGKVVLIDFWTYSCINCLRAIPYVRAWAQKYKDQGLVVVGVHAPEFAFERDVDNVRSAVSRLGITYPIAIDNDYAIWRAFDNHYWPAHYFIDVQGRIRHHHYGEGDYAGSERVIQALLTEAGRTDVATDIARVSASGVEMRSDRKGVRSPETYVGYGRAQAFASPDGAVRDTSHVYAAPAGLALNQWALRGDWTVRSEHAAANRPGAAIVYRFQARDLHLVLGPAEDGKPVRFVVTVDGKAPGDDRGVDVDFAGRGVVTTNRLYQLVRASGAAKPRRFEIRFLDRGVQAFAFTFG